MLWLRTSDEAYKHIGYMSSEMRPGENSPLGKGRNSVCYNFI